MKIKLIALAAAALVSGAANATLYSATANANEMFLNVWNASGSYTQDLGISFAAFSTPTPTFADINLSLSDTAFAAFIATGSAFQWTITGANSVGNFTTVTTLNGAAPAVPPIKGIVTPNVASINGLGLAVDGAIAGGTLPGQNVVDGTALYTVGTTASTYAGNGATSDTAYAAFMIAGTEANNSFASGLNFIKEATLPTGLTTVKATQTVYANTVAYMSNTGGAYTLNVTNVAAVPEPESLAMLLAGLGMVGSIAARRSRKA